MKVLVLGNYVFPFGEAKFAEDGGGVDRYTKELLEQARLPDCLVYVVDGFDVYGVKTRKIPYLRGKYLRNFSFNFMSFVTALTEDFDVLITHDIIATCFGVLLARLKGGKHYAHWHGGHWQPQYNLLIRSGLSTLKKVYALPDKVFVHDERTASYLQGIGAKTIVLRPGVGITPLPRQKQDKFTILFVGRLQKVKNADVFLEATKGLDANVWVVGDGPEKKDLEIMFSHAKFFGHKLNIASFLSKADLFVMPHQSEGFGLSTLEAMKCGVPCVVSDLGIPLPSPVDLVPVNDATALRNKIVCLMNSPEELQGLGVWGKKYVKGFSWKESAKTYVRELL